MSWQVEIALRLGALELDVQLEGGQRPVALVGPNGSGKTTVLRTIAGAHIPASGRIQLGDRVLFDASQGILLPPEERQVGYLPQGYGLFPHLRVIDNVAFGAGPRRPRLPRAERRRIAHEMLEQLECARLADRWPAALSAGQQQRVALARALVIEPQLMLLDEPLSALDATARRALRSVLGQHLAARRLPALIVTHDLRDVLALDADVFVIEEGRIVQHGSAATLARAPATAFIAELFHPWQPPSLEPPP